MASLSSRIADTGFLLKLLTRVATLLPLSGLERGGSGQLGLLATSLGFLRVRLGE